MEDLMGQRLLAALTIAVFVASTTLVAKDGKDDGRDNREKVLMGEKVLKKIEGTWRFTAQSMAGKDRPKEDLAKLTITFKGDAWTVKDDDKLVQAGTHKFDPTKKPGQIDGMVTEGEG